MTYESAPPPSAPPTETPNYTQYKYMDEPLYPKIYTTAPQTLPMNYVTYNPYQTRPHIVYVNPDSCHHRHKEHCHDDNWCLCTIV